MLITKPQENLTQLRKDFDQHTFVSPVDTRLEIF